MGVDVEGEEIREAQSTALADVHKKWHLPPAFSVEFIAYVLDRERRISTLKEQVENSSSSILYFILKLINF